MQPRESVPPPRQNPERPRIPADTHTARWFWPIIAMLLCLTMVVIHQRDRIRAHWWATRLADTTTTDPAAQTYYLASLAAVGDQATGAVMRLARHDRADVRAMAVVLLARLPDEGGLNELARLVKDPDLDVAESAALSLAFTNTPRSSRLLMEAVDSGEPQAAAAAVAAWSRVDSLEALDTLCEAARGHPHALVRAQAVESLTEWILGDFGGLLSPTRRSGSAPDSAGTEIGPRAAGQDEICDPIDALIAALSDRARFEGSLAMERQIDAAARVASIRQLPQTTFDPAASTQPATRTVAEIAAGGLARLTGHTLSPEETLTPAQRAHLADRCWQQLERWRAQQATAPQDPQSGDATSSDIPQNGG